MPSSHAHSWLPQNCINFVKPLVLNGTMPFYRIDAKFQLPANASRRTCAVTRRGSQGWLGFAFPPTLARRGRRVFVAAQARVYSVPLFAVAITAPEFFG
jgi:hypothetical protein